MTELTSYYLLQTQAQCTRTGFLEINSRPTRSDETLEVIAGDAIIFPAAPAAGQAAILGLYICAPSTPSAFNGGIYTFEPSGAIFVAEQSAGQQMKISDTADGFYWRVPLPAGQPNLVIPPNGWFLRARIISFDIGVNDYPAIGTPGFLQLLVKSKKCV